MRPPASDYQSHRKYSIGPTESVSAEETEERGGSYGYRVGKEKRSQTEGMRKNGGSSPSSSCAEGRKVDTWYRVGGEPGTPLVRRDVVSDNPIWIQVAIRRYWEFREHRPFIRWGALSDSSDSTYESYVTGNPRTRRNLGQETSRCAWLCDGPYFAPDSHDWTEDFHVGGKKGPAPKVNHHKIEVTLEVEKVVRAAVHLWFLLDHPQYADSKDLKLSLETESVSYSAQGRDFAKELNATGSFYRANRKGRDAYRSRVKEGTVPRNADTGKSVTQAEEFILLYKHMREDIWGREVVPFRAPGSKPPARIPYQEEKRSRESFGIGIGAKKIRDA